MLKKTLLATAVASLMSTSAFAMVLKTTDADADHAFTSSTDVVTSYSYSANVLANQTKDAVLAKTTYTGQIIAWFDQTNDTANGIEAELKDAGEIEFTLAGGATFNADNVAELLTAVSATAGGTGTLPGLAVSLNGTQDGADVYENASLGYTNNVAELARIFKISDNGVDVAVEYTLSDDNTKLTIKLADEVANSEETDDDATNLTINGSAIATGTLLSSVVVKLDLNSAALSQGITLPAVVQNGESGVTMSVGALQNASYTADAITSPNLFRFADLFTLTQPVSPQVSYAGQSVDVIANVGDSYQHWVTSTSTAIGSVTTTTSTDVSVVGTSVNGIPRTVYIRNNTTNQNIQHRFLDLVITGDFTGISTNASGYLLDVNGAATPWLVSGTTATATYSDLSGSTSANFSPATASDNSGYGAPLMLPTLVPTHTVGLPSQTFTLSVTQNDEGDTFNELTQNVSTYFVTTRNGMIFDTITTGTTSSNKIYIHDTSYALPTDGASIYVTIYEYDSEANGSSSANGTGGYTVLANRVALTTKLQSGGAVTLTPALVAAEVGASINTSRQARFVFEVESNQAEVAVKKQTSDGVDIKNGTRNMSDEVNFSL